MEREELRELFKHDDWALDIIGEKEIHELSIHADFPIYTSDKKEIRVNRDVLSSRSNRFRTIVTIADTLYVPYEYDVVYPILYNISRDDAASPVKGCMIIDC
jgi:hypothetical protein